MGHESFVYGLIAGADRNPGEARQTAAEIAALPTSDEWPFLTRAMFTIPPETSQGGHYRSQAIHFGASFKAVEWEWTEWLAKFEALLARLTWHGAWVHLRTEGTVGDYDYRYQPIGVLAHKPGQAEPTWRLSGGPRHFPFHAAEMLPSWNASGVWIFAGGAWSADDSPEI
jgi:hypothetical protein